jgi:ABC-type multidrug transport system fused ATPase/permease subunit
MTHPNISPGRILRILPQGERLALLGFFSVMLVAAIFETVGVASVLPFMAVVMDPSLAQRSRTMVAVLDLLGIRSPQGTLVAIGVIVVAMLLIGNAAAAGGQWVQQRFMARLQRRLSCELFAGYLAQPYAFHVQHDAASLTKVLFADISIVLNNGVAPLVGAATRGMVVVGLVALVLLRDPLIALGTMLLLGGSYFFIYRLVRGHQAHMGQEISASALHRQRIAIEGLGGIKELLVLERERDTVQRFDEATVRFTNAQVSNSLTAMLPRYLLETIAFGGIVIVTLTLVLSGRGLEAAIPTLSLYAFVGYRLMPALQQIFSAAVTVRFIGASLDSLGRDLDMVRKRPVRSTSVSSTSAVLRGRHDLRLDDVHFTYPGTTQEVLRGVSLVIHRNESIGLVGRTGAGKTTLADLVLGLFEPTSGTISIGDVPLGPRTLHAWRERVGYVPQTVFLANATIAQNIAFGLPDDQIDHEAVVRAARMAQADEFVAGLADGLSTLVGERGVRLSGGQRQRLGIARALYHNPDVLVFDEATSALDGMTEEAVMQAIRSLSKECTIILIAHRLRTVEACNRIVMLEAGFIVADGSYGELMEGSPEFRNLVGRASSAVTADANASWQ